MRRLVATVGLVALAGCTAPSETLPPAETAELAAEVEAYLRGFGDSFNNRDIDAMVRFYSEEAELIAPDASAVGLVDIEGFWRPFRSTPDLGWQLGTVFLSGAGVGSAGFVWYGPAGGCPTEVGVCTDPLVLLLEVEDGLITRQFGVEPVGALVSRVDDLPTAALRTEAAGGLEHLTAFYAEYRAAWSSGKPESIAALYGQGAQRVDSLFGATWAEGSIDQAAWFGDQPARRGSLTELDMVTLVPEGGARGPAVFSGLFALRASRAVAVFEVGGGACVGRVMLDWTFAAERLVEESVWYELASIRRCGAPGIAAWWEGLEAPRIPDPVLTGSATSADGEVLIYNGSPRLEQLVVWAFGRFASAGLATPAVRSITFAPVEGCRRTTALTVDSGESMTVTLCFGEETACLDADCSELSVVARLNLLHELGHAWNAENLDVSDRDRFVADHGLAAWNGEGLSWAEQGTESAAEVLAWGLMDTPFWDARLRQLSCEELAESFRRLTDRLPIYPPGECRQ